MSSFKPSSRKTLESTSAPCAGLQREAALHPDLWLQRSWTEVHAEISRDEFWKSFLKSRILPDSLEDYPITAYEDYRATLESSRAQPLSALTNRPVIWWAKSSGTSGEKRKLFPVTEALAQKRRIRRLLSLNGSLRLLRGASEEFRELRLGGTSPVTHPETHIPTGHMTAFERTYLQELSANQVLPGEIFSDSSTFDAWASIFALSTDLTSITTVTPAKLTWILRDIEANLERYLSFLSGSRLPPAGIAKPRIDPQRLKALRSLPRNRSQSLKVSDLWPSLQLIYTWKTASGRFLLNDLKPFLSEEVQVLQGHFISSESDHALPSSDPGKDFGPLDLLYGVHEFLKIGDPVESGSLKKSWELEVGSDYEIIVTNVMGLVRYRMRDVIQCRGYDEKNPLIEFKQKLDAYVDLVECRIQYSQLAESLGRAAFDLSATPSGRWVFIPSESRTCLEFILSESTGGTSTGNPDLIRIDSELQRIHPGYHNLRRVGQLGPVVLVQCRTTDPFWKKFPEISAESKPPVLKNLTYAEASRREEG